MHSKIILVSFVVLGCAYLALGSVGHIEPTTNDEFPGQCWDKEAEKAHKVGDQWPLENCLQASCNEDFSTSILGCGLIGLPKGYHLKEDASAPYPDCCPKPEKDE